MSKEGTIFEGSVTEVFAGIPVKDFKRSCEWYERFFGCSPSFFPNDREAVWSIGEQRWVYIIVDPERAGGSIQTFMCDRLEEVIAKIEARGLSFIKDECPDAGVRKVMYHDPDGNEVGVGRVPAE